MDDRSSRIAPRVISGATPNYRKVKPKADLAPKLKGVGETLTSCLSCRK